MSSRRNLQNTSLNSSRYRASRFHPRWPGIRRKDGRERVYRSHILESDSPERTLLPKLSAPRSPHANPDVPCSSFVPPNSFIKLQFSLLRNLFSLSDLAVAHLPGFNFDLSAQRLNAFPRALLSRCVQPFVKKSPLLLVAS
jgi:hypothetical protein